MNDRTHWSCMRAFRYSSAINVLSSRGATDGRCAAEASVLLQEVQALLSDVVARLHLALQAMVAAGEAPAHCHSLQTQLQTLAGTRVLQAQVQRCACFFLFCWTPSVRM